MAALRVAPAEYGPFHRVETRIQTPSLAAEQIRSGRLCGQSTGWLHIPAVKAYRGPLPAGERGIEFMTDVPPDSGRHPSLMLWRRGSPGVTGESGGLVCIPIRVTKNAQVIENDRD